VRDSLKDLDKVATQDWGRMGVTRILWKAIIDAPSALADVILGSTAQPFDFTFVDDVSGRTCLHEAAMAGAPRLVSMCLKHGVAPDRTDLYGRTALHYACLLPARPESEADALSAAICRQLLAAGTPADAADKDGYTALIHATQRGSVKCIRTLLEAGARAVPHTLGGALIPLALAAQAGHLGVVHILLAHGAESVPNTNGEYPIHLAAREGRADVVRVLLQHPGWDTPDKYNDWTPLFHAARGGHVTCVEVLLQAGVRVDAVDEFGYTAEYYAAWHGHRACVDVLIDAIAHLPSRRPLAAPVHVSPLVQEGRDELDAIPSLSLPPPIMPYRVYGHNYLDRVCLVQVTLGRTRSMSGGGSGGGEPAVQLRGRLAGAQGAHATTAPFLKLVMSGPPEALLAPYSVALPLKEDCVAFSFQIASVEALSLEFSLYPNFGTKMVGRAIALPSMFAEVPEKQALRLPLVDQRLHVIGEVKAYEKE
jgi:CDK inhibitor PHO81